MKCEYKITEENDHLKTLSLEISPYTQYHSAEKVNFETLLYLRKEVIQRLEEEIDHEIERLLIKGLLSK